MYGFLSVRSGLTSSLFLMGGVIKFIAGKEKFPELVEWLINSKFLHGQSSIGSPICTAISTSHGIDNTHKKSLSLLQTPMQAK